MTTPTLRPRGTKSKSRPKQPPEGLLATTIRVTGEPLDPSSIGQIVKPRELVDIIEVTPLNRSELLLYNQLLAHAWNEIKTNPVHAVRKAHLRGSHDSNDRLNKAFDTLMSAWAKVRIRDPQTGDVSTLRVHLLGTNKEEDAQDGWFSYTFPSDLLDVISRSQAWATLQSHIMYSLKSKYAIRLYELIEQRIGLQKQSEMIAVDDFRRMLGVPKGKLKRFADLNKYAVKPALAEVNQLSDFYVQIGTVKRGRAIEKLMLSWGRKDADQRRAAHEERERSRIGRNARRHGVVQTITVDA